MLKNTRIPVISETQHFMLLLASIGTRVRVYWNLHKHCYSVQTQTKIGWRVAAHVYCPFMLDNVMFSVNEKLRQQVIKTRRKEVHAYIIGNVTDSYCTLTDLTGSRVTYDPYRYSSFVYRSNHKPVQESRAVLLSFASKGDVRIPEVSV